ncbi:MAG: inorganic phosphate transporter [Chitinophagales bacterium]|nr:inorganic phosphate transporter [Chitinophagales bacterium]
MIFNHTQLSIAVLVFITVILVIIFDFTNGFHDASNIIATVIASRALSPAKAVVIVAFFHFIGPILGGTAVANTIGKFVEIADIPKIDAVSIILSALVGVIVWNLGTWWLGMPSSSSHALMGGVCGVVMVAVGIDHVVWGFTALTKGEITGVAKVLLSLLISPILGFSLGYIIQKIVALKLRSAKHEINKPIKNIQLLSVAGLSFSHGANDAQKSMGILTLTLVLGGYIPSFAVPFWVILTCAGAMTLGVLFGGWKIVRTLGFAIYKIRPIHALNSQIASALVIFGASHFGAPVSTTHIVTTSIMGVGAAEHVKRVKWTKAKSIAYTWLFTIPGAAAVSILVYAIIHLFTT